MVPTAQCSGATGHTLRVGIWCSNQQKKRHIASRLSDPNCISSNIGQNARMSAPGTPCSLAKATAYVSNATESPHCAPRLPVVSGVARRSCRFDPSSRVVLLTLSGGNLRQPQFLVATNTAAPAITVPVPRFTNCTVRLFRRNNLARSASSAYPDRTAQ